MNRFARVARCLPPLPPACQVCRNRPARSPARDAGHPAARPLRGAHRRLAPRLPPRVADPGAVGALSLLFVYPAERGPLALRTALSLRAGGDGLKALSALGPPGLLGGGGALLYLELLAPLLKNFALSRCCRWPFYGTRPGKQWRKDGDKAYYIGHERLPPSGDLRMSESLNPTLGSGSRFTVKKWPTSGPRALHYIESSLSNRGLFRWRPYYEGSKRR